MNEMTNTMLASTILSQKHARDHTVFIFPKINDDPHLSTDLEEIPRNKYIEKVPLTHSAQWELRAFIKEMQSLVIMSLIHKKLLYREDRFKTGGDIFNSPFMRAKRKYAFMPDEPTSSFFDQVDCFKKLLEEDKDKEALEKCAATLLEDLQHLSTYLYLK